MNYALQLDRLLNGSVALSIGVGLVIFFLIIFIVTRFTKDKNL
jgi:hypothetical protein